MDDDKKYDKSCSKHPSNVAGFKGSIADLAKKVGNLSYDSLELFLADLAADLERQADADNSRGRTKLAERLYETSGRVYQAKDAMHEAWKICAPYMKNKLDK